MTSTHRWLRTPEDPDRLVPGTGRPQELRSTEPVSLPQAERRRRIGELVAGIRSSLDLALRGPEHREAIAGALGALARLEGEIATLLGTSRAPGAPTTGTTGFALPPEGVPLETVERSLVEQALERAGGNRTRAGELLGLTRDQVRYRIDKFGLDGGERS